MKVVIITAEQAKSLNGIELNGGGFYNPIKMADGNFYITEVEQKNSRLDWIIKITAQIT